MALPTASDNPFPSLLITEGTEPAAPAAGKQRLYIDSTSHKLKRTDSSGVDVTVEPTGALTSSAYTMTTARLLGRTSASTGAVEEITVGTGLTLSAGSLTASGSATLTTGEAVLSGDVTLVNAFGTTLYDGPSASLAAGTYLVSFQVLFGVIVGTSQGYEWFTKLWDGTNIFGQGYGALPVAANYNGYAILVSGSAVFTLGSTQTIKLTSGCTRGSSASKMLRDDGSFGLTSHFATNYTYVKTA